MPYGEWEKRLKEDTIFGREIGDRPDADAVKVGTVFILVVDPLEVFMSDGQDWVEVN